MFQDRIEAERPRFHKASTVLLALVYSSSQGLHRIGYQLGGAQLTQDARRATFGTFAQAMREKGYGIKSAAQIPCDSC